MHAEGNTPAELYSRSATTIPIEGLEPIEVEAALDGETVLIELRPDSDRASEGLPGAVAVTSGELMSWAAGTWIDSPFELARGRRIIVYSSTDSESRSTVEDLREMGFERAAYLIGGLDRWARHQARETASPDATNTEETER